MFDALATGYLRARRSDARATGHAHRLQRPAISVGNISTGGRGKTPVVAALARLLVEWGERPAILSRGYGRRVREDGVVVVSDGVHLHADVDRAGDEPLLLARDAPGAAVFVSEQRSIAGVLAEHHFGCTVHILDDGFQHLDLARDIDLVIVTRGDLDDHMFPIGKLREPVGVLASADAVIVEDEEQVPSTLSARSEPAREPVGHHARFQLVRSIGSPVPLDADRPCPSSERDVFAVSAIARPERFTQSLMATGWNVGGSMAFGDHHRFTRADLERVAASAAASGARIIVTTAKDAMRLLVHRPFPFTLPIAYVPLSVSVEPRDAFESWLRERLAQARR